MSVEILHSDLAQETVVLHFTGAAEETDGSDIESLTVVDDPERPSDNQDEDDDICLVDKSFVKSREHLPSLRNMFYRFVDNRFSPAALILSLYCPPGMIQVRAAQKRMI